MASSFHNAQPYVFTLRSHPAEILQTTEDICRFCEQQARKGAGLKLQTAAIDKLRLVLVEALNNITEHAYDNKTSGSVDIRLWLEARTRQLGLHIKLKDEGHENQHGVAPKRLDIDPENPFELPEGGFGLNIMHQLCEELRYYRENDYNYFELRLLLEAEADSSGA